MALRAAAAVHGLPFAPRAISTRIAAKSFHCCSVAPIGRVNWSISTARAVEGEDVVFFLFMLIGALGDCVTGEGDRESPDCVSPDTESPDCVTGEGDRGCTV